MVLSNPPITRRKREHMTSLDAQLLPLTPLSTLLAGLPTHDPALEVEDLPETKSHCDVSFATLSRSKAEVLALMKAWSQVAHHTPLTLELWDSAKAGISTQFHVVSDGSREAELVRVSVVGQHAYMFEKEDAVTFSPLAVFHTPQPDQPARTELIGDQALPATVHKLLADLLQPQDLEAPAPAQEPDPPPALTPAQEPSSVAAAPPPVRLSSSSPATAADTTQAGAASAPKAAAKKRRKSEVEALAPLIASQGGSAGLGGQAGAGDQVERRAKRPVNAQGIALAAGSSPPTTAAVATLPAPATTTIAATNGKSNGQTQKPATVKSKATAVAGAGTAGGLEKASSTEQGDGGKGGGPKSRGRKQAAKLGGAEAGAAAGAAAGAGAGPGAAPVAGAGAAAGAEAATAAGRLIGSTTVEPVKQGSSNAGGAAEVSQPGKEEGRSLEAGARASGAGASGSGSKARQSGQKSSGQAKVSEGSGKKSRVSSPGEGPAGRLTNRQVLVPHSQWPTWQPSVHERKPPDGFRGQVQSCAKGQAHVKVFSLHKDGKTDALVASWPVQEVEKWLVPEGTEMTQKAYTEQLFRKP